MKRTLLAVLGLALWASAALSQPTVVDLDWATVGWRDTVTMVGAVSPKAYYTAGFDISQLDPTAFLPPGSAGKTNGTPDSTVALKFYVEITGTAVTTDSVYIGYDTSNDNLNWRAACDYVATVASGTKQFEVHVPFDARKLGGTQYGWLGQRYMRLKAHPGYVTSNVAHGIKARAVFYKTRQAYLKQLAWRNPTAWPRDSVVVTFKAAGTSGVPDTTTKVDISQIAPLTFVPRDSINATLVSPDSLWAIKLLLEVTGAQNTNGDSLWVQWDTSTDGVTWRQQTTTWRGILAAGASGSKLYELHVPFNVIGFGGSNRGWWGEKYLRFRVRGDFSGKQLDVKPYVYFWKYAS